MFVTGGIREKQPLHAGCGVERQKRDGGWPFGAFPIYLRSSFLGRTTQRANSPIKAPAAAMAIIWEFLRNRYEDSIRPGCFALFTRMLNVCYRNSPAPAPSVPRLSQAAKRRPMKNSAQWLARSNRLETIGAGSIPPGGPLPGLLVLQELARQNDPGNEQQYKGACGGNSDHPASPSRIVMLANLDSGCYARFTYMLTKCYVVRHAVRKESPRAGSVKPARGDGEASLR